MNIVGRLGGEKGQEQEIAQLLDALPGMVWRTDERGSYNYFNRSWLNFRGKGSEHEMDSGWVADVHPNDQESVRKSQEEAWNSRKRFVRQFRLKGWDNQYHWLEDTGGPIIINDEFKGYCGTAFDITSRFNNEQSLTQMVEQTETLLKETNHRFKNSLQILVSLLSLYRQQSTNAQARSMFQDCQNRVTMVLLLHQKLFQGATTDSLDFSNYFRELTSMVSNSYRMDRQEIKVNLEIEPIHIHPDKVLPCGLIVTELLTNSFKHAFSNHRDGQIHFRFAAAGNDCVLEIGDGGSGIQGKMPIDESKSLGLRLVSALVRQLGGHMTLLQQEGTKFRIQFPR